MKKRLAFALSLILILSALTACGNGHSQYEYDTSRAAIVTYENGYGETISIPAGYAVIVYDTYVLDDDGSYEPLCYYALDGDTFQYYIYGWSMIEYASSFENGVYTIGTDSTDYHFALVVGCDGYDADYTAYMSGEVLGPADLVPVSALPEID